MRSEDGLLALERAPAAVDVVCQFLPRRDVYSLMTASKALNTAVVDSLWDTRDFFVPQEGKFPASGLDSRSRQLGSELPFVLGMDVGGGCHAAFGRDVATVARGGNLTLLQAPGYAWPSRGVAVSLPRFVRRVDARHVLLVDRELVQVLHIQSGALPGMMLRLDAKPQRFVVSAVSAVHHDMCVLCVKPGGTAVPQLWLLRLRPRIEALAVANLAKAVTVQHLSWPHVGAPVVGVSGQNLAPAVVRWLPRLNDFKPPASEAPPTTLLGKVFKFVANTTSQVGSVFGRPTAKEVPAAHLVARAPRVGALWHSPGGQPPPKHRPVMWLPFGADPATVSAVAASGDILVVGFETGAVGVVNWALHAVLKPPTPSPSKSCIQAVSVDAASGVVAYTTKAAAAVGLLRLRATPAADGDGAGAGAPPPAGHVVEELPPLAVPAHDVKVIGHRVVAATRSEVVVAHEAQVPVQSPGHPWAFQSRFETQWVHAFKFAERLDAQAPRLALSPTRRMMVVRCGQSAAFFAFRVRCSTTPRVPNTWEAAAGASAIMTPTRRPVPTSASASRRWSVSATRSVPRATPLKAAEPPRRSNPLVRLVRCHTPVAPPRVAKKKPVRTPFKRGRGLKRERVDEPAVAVVQELMDDGHVAPKKRVRVP